MSDSESSTEVKKSKKKTDVGDKSSKKRNKKVGISII